VASEGDSLTTIHDLSDDDLLKLLKRLTLHADRKLARLRWRGVQGGAPPGGVRAEDIASDAITAVIAGTRTWDPKSQPDLLRYLRGVVDSMISKLVNSFDNRRTRRLGPPGGSGEASSAHEAAGREPDPAELASSREAAEAFRAPIVEALKDDDVAYQVFECLEADITKPSDVAEYLGLSVAEVNNAQKRLRRKVDDAIKPRKKGKSHG
jgi:DNA-directed RNA polymerase specialized sigma24 family protein